MTRQHPLPAEVYALVEHTPATVLLEGGQQNSSKTNRKPWTQLFTAPVRICAAHSLAEIPPLFSEIESAISAGHLAAGFFTYECGPCFEPKASVPGYSPSSMELKAATNLPPASRPLAWFGIFDRSYVFDHATGEFVGGEPQGLEKIRADSAKNSPQPPEPDPEIQADFALTESAYAERIAAIHQWIREGDVYQLNFTAPFRVELAGSIAAHYARLRLRQPVEYGAFIHAQPGRHILSFSPELFFRIDEQSGSRRIVTRPMKGTARRGRTTREDGEIAHALANDPKNRAENLMIVDLVRNDLGRIARFGTVHAENLFAVERYPTLWQMTSTVSAELRPDARFYDIFRALFPCGSITGAPKVRAMQLIAELEQAPRGVYTGAIGFFSPRQTVFNVAIRTLDLEGQRGVFGAGSGVVIDSDAREEYRECLLKASFLIGPAHRSTSPISAQVPAVPQPDKLFLIETMLWDGDNPLGSFPLLEVHLDRLEDSADYFGFSCDRDAVRAALEDHVRPFAGQLSAGSAPRKVRLLVDADGRVEIASEQLAPSDPSYIGRVILSNTRTDPTDAMLYHKTTQRPLYASEFARAQQQGYDDVLFLNLHGEVTEGAISNLFIEKDGRWFTPPIACGLLPGVYRRHLLTTRPDIEERILHLDDLRHADAIYITNAVRGLRRAEIVWPDEPVD
ncbi:MAG TPA: aminodeoxychorismate synthase component I [Terracidiphilus sp.]|nr:aminodeoxychorismate synthase component I [Terracidiphilus sp.]